ncbi:MAG: hypothetical protein AAB969_02860, partial [Patescibacteria group bacterium]
MTVFYFSIKNNPEPLLVRECIQKNEIKIKVPNDQTDLRNQDLSTDTCEHRGRDVGVPVAIEPVVVLVPPATVPKQITDTKADIGAAENCGPEKDVDNIAIF